MCSYSDAAPRSRSRRPGSSAELARARDLALAAHACDRRKLAAAEGEVAALQAALERPEVTLSAVRAGKVSATLLKSITFSSKFIDFYD